MDLEYASLQRKATIYNIVAFTAVGLFLLLLGYALHQVRINGPLYDQIRRDHDVVADSLPPTLYIVDPHLDLTEALLAAEQKSFDRSVALTRHALGARSQFDARVRYWAQNLESVDIQDAFTQQARIPASRYFDVVEQALLPALQRHDVAQARAVYEGTLTPLFQKHRLAIDRATELAKAEGRRNESAAERMVALTSVGVLIGAALLGGIWWWFLQRWWIKPLLRRTADVQAALGRIGDPQHDAPVDVGHQDEFGHILTALESMRIRLNIKVQELDAERVAAQAAERAKGEFLANMSHEIRTPMNAILGLTDLILRTDLSVRQRDLLTKSQEAGRALLGLIDQLLDLSKIESGAMVLESVPFKLQEVLDQVNSIVGDKAQQKGLIWQACMEPAVPELLTGDPHRLGQVLINLCNNAVKFTERGQVVLSVQPHVVLQGHCSLRFSVRDTGIGMSAQETSRLFKPFTQADTSTTRRYGGTGLGLAICKDLVERMGGTLGVSSSPGVGSEFFFTVPFKVEALPVPLLLPSAPAPDADARAASDWAGLKGKRVLLIEDNELNQLVASELLRDVAGMTVTVAGSGESALTQLQSHTFDAVLMDIQMQGLNGYETTRRLRASGLTAEKLPVIAMTAHASELDRQQCLAAGMNDYVTKPFKPASLFSVLLKWIAED